ncbi:nitrate/nitrite transporter [Streptomyces sp. NPDC002463]|uniref:MFS transporter n=1 Tax=Streptomyces sp. NPDC002463 TaxID=3364645 RepID=UPI003698D2D2
MTDRWGARRVFPLVALLTTLPVLYLGHLADSTAEVLAGGFLLGLGGTAFAVGVPFVNAWYPPARRGVALGIFGIGTGGTALSAFTTVQLTDAVGRAFPFGLVAGCLAVYAVVAWFLLRDRPGRATATGSLLSRTALAVRTPATWHLAFLYAVSFGGFVAFSVYLPTYLTRAYELGRSDAALRTAGFVVLAVAMRPLGGWLSDRTHPVPVLTGSYGLVAVCALVASFEADLVPVGTAAFLGMAAGLGAGSAAVFALVARLVPAERVGSVTGVVGTAGGLGGFFPPLVMGAVDSVAHDYTGGIRPPRRHRGDRPRPDPHGRPPTCACRGRMACPGSGWGRLSPRTDPDGRRHGFLPGFVWETWTATALFWSPRESARPTGRARWRSPPWTALTSSYAGESSSGSWDRPDRGRPLS